MRAFVRNHLERAARLAILKRLAEPTADPEAIIAQTVRTIAEEGDGVFPRYMVIQIAARACAIYDELAPMISFREAAEEAVRELENT